MRLQPLMWIAYAVASVVALATERYGLGVAYGDYGSPGCDEWRCDNPAPALAALADGDLSTFFREQPLMGPFSLLLRLPAVAIAGSMEDEYRAGAAICMGLALLIAAWLGRVALRHGAGLLPVALFLAVCVLAVTRSNSLFFGHPEEPLTALMALAAIVLAAERRLVPAGVMLALAIATKEWALLAAPGVLFAAGREEVRRWAVPAVAVAAFALGVMAVGNPDSFIRSHQERNAGHEHTVTPANVWFQSGVERLEVGPGGRVVVAVYPPEIVGRWCRPLVTVLALLLAALFLIRRGFRNPDALALVALILLCRVVLDTQTFSYHVAPMLAAVAAWEVLARRRIPVVGIAATAAFQVTRLWVAPELSSDAFNAVFLAWTGVLAVYLTVVSFAPARIGLARARSA